MRRHLVEEPLTDHVLASRTELVRWLVRVHNRVNRALGKPELTYKQALKVHSRCTPGTPHRNEVS